MCRGTSTLIDITSLSFIQAEAVEVYHIQQHLATAIPTSNLTHFTIKSLGIDVSSAKKLALTLTQSKTLEEVVVWEHEPQQCE